MNHPAALTLFVVRHGETDHNRRRLMQGRRIDAPLNELGAAQARALAVRFADEPLDAIYVSPLARARQTAAEVSSMHPDVPVHVDSDLAEMSWGEMEGQSIDAVGNELRAFASEWRRGRFDRRVGGGESILDVRARAEAVIARLLAQHVGQRVLAVTHGRFLRVFLSTALDAPGLPSMLRFMDRFEHANTGVYRLIHDGERFEADLLNCTVHLKDVHLKESRLEESEA